MLSYLSAYDDIDYKYPNPKVTRNTKGRTWHQGHFKSKKNKKNQHKPKLILLSTKRVLPK